MAIELTATRQASRSLQPRHVYLLAALCLVAGLAIGYSVRASRMPSTPAVARVGALPPGHPDLHSAPRPSLQQLQQMADKQAAPLIEKLKTDPNNTGLLIQVGALYHATHRFEQAAAYYRRAVQADPKNTAFRTKLAASLYRGGDVEGALGQLSAALTYDPKDANALFNMGLIEWEGRQDARGALAAWKQLLKSNPQLSPERKATVQKLMAQAESQSRASAGN